MIADPKNRKTKPSNLREVIFWPTPRAHENGQNLHFPERGYALSAKVKLYPTMDVGAAKGRGEKSAENRGRLGGTLNPTWVEWLMGYPAGWTDCADSEMPSSRKSRKR